MNPFIQKLLTGALAGFMAAILVDIHAWQNDGFAFSWAKQFDWSLALKRWATGLITGAFAAVGISETTS